MEDSDENMSSLDLGLGSLSQMSQLSQEFKDIFDSCANPEIEFYTQIRDIQNVVSYREDSPEDQIEVEGEQGFIQADGLNADMVLHSIFESISNSDGMTDMGQMANNPNQFNSTRGNVVSPSYEGGNVLPDTTRSSVIPSNTNYLGPFNFQIEFLNQPEKVTKSTSWTYSEQLDKLYVDMGVSCIVCFKVKKLPSSGCIIRALPIYEKSEHVSNVVKRCPTHSLASDQSNNGHIAPEHFIRCESDQAHYHEDPSSGRQSVEVPFVGPQAGNDSSQYLFSFMCLGSCPGGPNRRPIKIIFTLENGGNVLGRRALSVRVCACPGRDRKTDEKNLLCPKDAKKKPSHPTLVQTSTADLCVAEMPTKKRKSDDDIYTLQVRGRSNYETLLKVKQCMELASMVPSDTLQAYLNEQRQLQWKGEPRNKPKGCCKAKQIPLKKPKFPPPTAGATTSSSVPLRGHSQASTSRSTENLDEHAVTNGTLSPSEAERETAAKKPRLRRAVSNSSQASTSHRNEESPSNSQTNKRELPQSVESWLSSIDMDDYLNLFAERGLLHMSQLENFTEDDLRTFHIGDAHRNVIWKALQVYQTLSNSWTSSQESRFSSYSQSGSGQPSVIRFQRIRFKRVSSIKKTDHDYSS